METSMLEKLKDAKHVWIYGAGYIGRKVMERIENCGFSVEGFTISAEGKRKQQNGYPVVSFKEIKTSAEDTFFLIAVTEQYQPEIMDNLNRNGYRNYTLWSEKLWLEICRLSEYSFDDRRKGYDKVCFILGGYKEFLWEDVFERLKRFIPNDVEVCLLSSGITSKRLSQIAEENDWSYLSTKINSVTLIQNIAFSLFETSKWIYKMDEDIFLTERCFEKLYDTYKAVEEREPYRVGFTAPLIPVNGYGFIRLLDKLERRALYEQRFERVYYGCHPESMLEKDIEAAKFMWGVGGEMPQLDDWNRMSSGSICYSFCNVRFSIGFILFKRKLWKAMQGFPVTGNADMGLDEEEMCEFCMNQSLAITVAENCVVGHFSFGQQTERMKEFYLSNREYFRIKEGKN